eukprot:s810_g30.t1
MRPAGIGAVLGFPLSFTSLFTFFPAFSEMAMMTRLRFATALGLPKEGAGLTLSGRVIFENLRAELLLHLKDLLMLFRLAHTCSTTSHKLRITVAGNSGLSQLLAILTIGFWCFLWAQVAEVAGASLDAPRWLPEKGARRTGLSSAVALRTNGRCWQQTLHGWLDGRSRCSWHITGNHFDG